MGHAARAAGRVVEGLAVLVEGSLVDVVLAADRQRQAVAGGTTMQVGQISTSSS